MKKHLFTSIPNNYPVCQHSDCKLAKKCLHYLAYTHLVKTEEWLRLINPRQCTKDNQCTHYRNSKPVTYALGFTNFQKHMFPEQYQTFMHILIDKFGRDPYFKRRRGDIAITPKDQQTILDALKKAKVSKELRFDAYEELVNWDD